MNLADTLEVYAYISSLTEEERIVSSLVNNDEE